MRLLTGVAGTPMPAIADSVEDYRKSDEKDADVRDASLWDLANYVRSLGPERVNWAPLLSLPPATGDVPDDPNAEFWAKRPGAAFPLVGQVIADPRNFNPTVDMVTVRAVYTDREAVFHLTWDDPTASDPTKGAPKPDMVAIQLPTGQGAGDRPYFLMGDGSHPVYLLTWRAGAGVGEATATGAGKMTPQAGEAIQAKGQVVYDAGQYRAVIRRPLKTADSSDFAFRPGEFFPVAFWAWDGSEGDEGPKAAVSTWYYATARAAALDAAVRHATRSWRSWRGRPSSGWRGGPAVGETRRSSDTRLQGGRTSMKQSIVVSVLAVAVLATGVALFTGPPVSAQGGGSISGEVKFAGAAPAPKVVKVNKDNEVCGQEKKVADVVVGAGGGLSEALVSVTGAKGAKPAKPAVLDQKGCEFQPDVVVMAPGELKILNSDGVLHNIHTFSTANPPINKAQPKFKKEMVEKLEKPELIKVQCDAHSWMLGWIFVTDTPTAVTDGNGAFKLENVPPGKHKVEVVHPVLGKQTKEVEVKAGQDTKVAFELKK